MNDGTKILDHIDYKGHRYVYEYRPGKKGDICLATKDPKRYCNGFYSYSTVVLWDLWMEVISLL